jgi:PncC family amidohydrolase
VSDIASLSERCGHALAGRGLTVSVAESCTGGLLGGAITAAPGSSRYFQGGVIAYDNSVKEHVLAVPREILDMFGAVSRQTVLAMAEGVRRLLRTDCSIAVSGIAGPGGGTIDKPVGLVWIAVACGERVAAAENHFGGGRESVRRAAVVKSLEMALEMLD